jgi:hypothetical protein
MTLTEKIKVHPGYNFRRIFFLALMILPVKFYAQYSSNSTYSFFGIGDIKASRPIRSEAMGGAALALPSENNINNLNPASLIRFDSTTFLFTAGINGYMSSFESGKVSKTARDFNFNHLAFGFPIAKWWATAVGAAPFSSVGYNVRLQLPIEGTASAFETEFKGSGGVTQFYMLNTFHPVEPLSVGINVSYLMGTVRHTEVDKLTEFDYPDVTKTDTRYFRNFYYILGLQFNQNLGNDRLSLGITVNPPQKLKIRHDIGILIPNVDTISTESDNRDNFEIPLAIGAGIGYNINSIFQLAFDWSLKKWSDVPTTFRRASLTDSYHYNFGMEFTPKETLMRNYLRMIHYRAGAYYEKSYLQMRGNDITDRGLTIGAGLPIGRQGSTLDVAIGLGRLGTLNEGLIRETYGSIKIGFNFRDYWFVKRRFD